MSDVLIATCAPGDVDPDGPVLLAALADEGLAARLAIWDDPREKWNDAALVVVRSTWDYAARRGEFLEWARGVERLANPYDALEYSSDKHYLSDLARRGVAVVESSFVEVGEPAVFPDGDFVVKPCVGAGSIDADRYGRHDHAAARAHVARLHELGRAALIQPYVASVDEIGERACVFIGGAFSHLMVKGAMLNVAADERDVAFRRSQMSRGASDDECVAAARATLGALGRDDLLYARVDVLRDGDQWRVLELELVEPWLFLAYDDTAPARLARAIAARVNTLAR